uniref:Uncharacterized protein n=1 Tax=Parascaris univalens TaxID=6257 RepID=A0A914ZHG5_PARUN
MPTASPAINRSLLHNSASKKAYAKQSEECYKMERFLQLGTLTILYPTVFSRLRRSSDFYLDTQTILLICRYVWCRGIVSEKDYAHKGKEQSQCGANGARVCIKLVKFAGRSEDVMADFVFYRGPITVDKRFV